MLCALRTVLRLGELVALQWGDIDWNGRFIEVQRNLVQGRADLAEVPQAAQGRPSTQLQDALVGWRRALQARWLKRASRCRCGCFPPLGHRARRAQRAHRVHAPAGEGRQQNGDTLGTGIVFDLTTQTQVECGSGIARFDQSQARVAQSFSVFGSDLVRFCMQENGRWRPSVHSRRPIRGEWFTGSDAMTEAQRIV